MINDFNTQWSMIPTMDDHSSFTNLGPPDPPPDSPLAALKPLFRVPTSASKFDLSSKPWNPLNKAQNPPKTLPKTLPKRLQNSILSSNARNPQKMQPSHTKTSFLMFPGLQKSSQNRGQNASKIASYLPTLEIFKKCNPPIRKPNFWRCRAFRNRFKIDAKTPSRSALCWMPSWNPKKCDFWC